MCVCVCVCVCVYIYIKSTALLTNDTLLTHTVLGLIELFFISTSGKNKKEN